MLSSFYRLHVRQFFRRAGVTLNGPNPFDPQVRNPKAYRRIFWKGPLGFLECYIDRSIECDDLYELSCRVLNSCTPTRFNPVEFALALKTALINQQTKYLGDRVAKLHYDITPELFTNMLGIFEFYTCAYWENRARNLDEAQQDKGLLIGRKLMLKPGMTVLDIGCGYGELAKFLAERYGVTVVGITLSEAQLMHAKKKCAHLSNVTFRLMNYLDLPQEYRHMKFDRIVSVGMFEHAGRKNYGTFFKIASSVLKDDGIMLLHSIVGVLPSVNPAFLEKYIFPGGQLPAAGDVERTSFAYFKCRDHHEFGLDYAKTLRAWGDNFKSWWDSLSYEDKLRLFGNAFPRYWKKLSPEECVDHFYRLWECYIQTNRAVFASYYATLTQWVLTKNGYDHGELPKVRDVRTLCHA